MAFIEYRPRHDAKENIKMIVSLSKSSIVLNRVAREKLQTPEFVSLAYDPEESVIKIAPSTKEEGTILNKTKVFAKGFYNFFGITINGKFKATHNEEENALYINISPENKELR